MSEPTKCRLCGAPVVTDWLSAIGRCADCNEFENEKRRLADYEREDAQNKEKANK